MTPLLQVENLRGGYGRAPILRDVSFMVAADEIVALLGANGAGKTTLLRGLSGSLPVARGDVRIDGRPLRRAPWARSAAGLAHVPEGRHVFGAMTVRENLEAAGLVRRQRVPLADIYAVFPRLEERQGQQAGTLSGGEQQMLAIGRALMTAPRVLAIDELSAGLAPAFVQQLLANVAQLRGRGIGILLVEQSPHYIADLADRVIVLENGQVVAEGSLAAIGGVDSIARRYLGVHDPASRDDASRTQSRGGS